jgi:RimJ/RimL family protein N-acetyltransferase
MKFNENELSIIPATPRYAKDHMEIYKYAHGYLDDFLEITDGTDLLTFQQHNLWIQRYRKESQDHPTFMLKYWQKVVGLILFGEPYFEGGVQFTYLMNKNYAGRGLMTGALEHALKIAFLSHKFLFVELHIDINNLSSQKVAQKLGFEVIDTYETFKTGKKSSGHIEIWGINNDLGPAFWRQIPKESWMRNTSWIAGQRHPSFRSGT